MCSQRKHATTRSSFAKQRVWDFYGFRLNWPPSFTTASCDIWHPLFHSALYFLSHYIRHGQLTARFRDFLHFFEFFNVVSPLELRFTERVFRARCRSTIISSSGINEHRKSEVIGQLILQYVITFRFRRQ